VWRGARALEETCLGRLSPSIVLPQGWQRWRGRGFGAWSAGAVQTVLPFIACRAEACFERGAVGRRLGRGEDEGLWLRVAALVPRAGGGPV
jgi:hypothetical protein